MKLTMKELNGIIKEVMEEISLEEKLNNLLILKMIKKSMFLVDQLLGVLVLKTI